MFDEGQPYALRGGGDSRTNRTTKIKKLIKLKAETQEKQWQTMLADAGLRPQDQLESEEFSSNSSSSISDDSSSTIGETDSDNMSVDNLLGNWMGKNKDQE